jgi:pimeloyl-ACP methyl ester carboxylesterase
VTRRGAGREEQLRLQSFLRAVAPSGRDVVCVPPFTAYLDRRDPLRYVNFAARQPDLVIPLSRRHHRLRDRFRCIAPDYPGFGLSRAAPGYRYTPVEHAAVVERLVEQLDLTGVTMMVQDWGGPIGFAAATGPPIATPRS